MDRSDIEACLSGAFDLECRCAPYAEGYSTDHFEAAEQALSLGLAGLVFRDDGYCTTPIAALLEDTDYRDAPISLSGSVALNNISGGMNFYAAEHALMLGARVVSMPTVSAENRLRAGRWPSQQPPRGPDRPRALTALGARGNVSAEAREVLEVVADHDGVLDAGCLHVSEVLALFREALKLGVTRLLACDPVRRNGATAVDLEELLDLGASVEFLPQADLDGDMLRLVQQRAPTRIILGLDTGPAGVPRSLTDRYCDAVRFWFALGFDRDTVSRSISDNSAALIGQARPQSAGRAGAVQ